MAILEKRKSVNKLPQAGRYQNIRAGDRAAALRGEPNRLRSEAPITSAIRQLTGPMQNSQGFTPMGGSTALAGSPTGGAGKAAVDKFGNMAGQPKTAVTSALKGSTATKNASGVTAGKTTAGTALGAGATSKLPGLTSKTSTGKVTTPATTAKTLTSAGTGAAKTKGAKVTGSTGSTLGNTLTSALTGAALGAGTKFVVDKLTGAKKAGAATGETSGKTIGDAVASLPASVIKKTVATDGTGLKATGTSGTGLKATGTSGTGLKTAGTGAGAAKTIDPTSVIKGLGAAAVKAVGPKTPTASGPKKPVGAGPKKPVGATESATKAGDDSKDDEPPTSTRDDEEDIYIPGDDTVGGGTLVGGDGNTITDEDSGADDSTTQIMDDGTVISFDANGNVISYTDTDGSTYDAEGNEIATGDDSGSTETLSDGTVVTYDKDGNFISYTDPDGSMYDTEGNTIGGESDIDEEEEEDTTENVEEDAAEDAEENVEEDAEEDTTETGYFSDPDGNIYDSNGDLYQYADGSSPYDEVASEEDTSTDVAYTDDYGNTYNYDGDLIAEGDHSDYVYTAEDGSTYDYDGNLIQEADHSDFVQYDDFGNSYDYNGDIIAYSEGYGPKDEYAEEDDYTDEEEVAAKGGLMSMKNGGAPVHMLAGGNPSEDVEPVSEEDNGDGTITQYFDDGSSITYDEDNEVVSVTDAEGIEESSDSGGGDEGVEESLNSEGSDSDNAQLKTGNLSRSVTPYLTAEQANEILRDNAITRKAEDRQQAEDDFNETESINKYRVANGLPPLTGTTFDPALYNISKTNTPVALASGNIEDKSNADNTIVNAPNAKTEDGAAATPTGGLTQANQNIEYFDDGSYRVTNPEDGTSIIFDADGKAFSSTDNEGNTEIANTSTYDNAGNQTISDYYGNVVQVLDPQGNVIPLGGRIDAAPITSAGGSGAVGLTKDKTPAEKIAENRENKASDTTISDLMTKLNTYGGAGAAGAVIGGLLGNTDLFGGGGGGSSFDMTGVGEIKPRTTTFGIGPSNYVGYDEYGTPEEMPDLYGNELYQNLNAPGFNEVSPGDYERMSEEEVDNPVEEVETMAEGGMPQGGLGQSGQTYYTFGTPVDPLQNLRNPRPFQQQPQNAQQAPQQMPQMGMPQEMPPQMRKGGLPHVSNVPMTQGRMDFRQGSAVHGEGDGQSDDIPAMLADGEYVFDADTVAQIGNGSTKAGAAALDKFRENIRRHKRSAPVNKIPPKTKALTSYLKGAR